MQKNWDRVIAAILTWEGGYADRNGGGAVNHGITLNSLRDVSPNATKADLKALTAVQAADIYRTRFAGPIGFAGLPNGYDAVMMNAAVMQGVNGAKALDAVAKGDIGLMTALHMQKKMQDPHCAQFGPGWSNRLVAFYELARELQAA
jgi:lysozyme family protein